MLSCLPKLILLYETFSYRLFPASFLYIRLSLTLFLISVEKLPQAYSSLKSCELQMTPRGAVPLKKMRTKDLDLAKISDECSFEEVSPLTKVLLSHLNITG